MHPTEMMIWSAVTGAVSIILLLAVADALYSRNRSSVNALIYLTGNWLFVILLSGLPGAVLPQMPAGLLHVLQVLVGPLTASMGCYGASLWLSAHKRDRTVEVGLRFVAATCLAGGPLSLLASLDTQLLLSACLTVLCRCLLVWLCVRGAWLGDRMAWGLAGGFFLTLPLQIGMYWLALGDNPPGIAAQAATGMTGLVGLTMIAFMIWIRSRQEQVFRNEDHSLRDSITQLYASVVIIQKIILAQRRLMRTRRDGALMAVVLFDPERLAAQVGQTGLNDIYVELAKRMQRYTGMLNPAGRYYDRCFLVLMETIHSPSLIRTVGLRVASSLRRPVAVTSLEGESIRVTADIAVGIVHLSSAGIDVDQLLHEVQSVAEAARTMRSRVALLDPQSRQAISLDRAELGGSWQAMKEAEAKKAAKVRPVMAPAKR